jgi:hypothetical protein
MSVELQWTDTDPDTGERRWVSAEIFARQWRFKVRWKRREDWTQNVPPTAAMWADLLDGLERRLPRREGVTEEMVEAVREKWRESGGTSPLPDDGEND